MSVSIKPYQEEEYIAVGSIFETINYIPLETTSQGAVISVDKLEVTENLLLIWDRATNAVYFFDREGKYLRKISNKNKLVPDSYDIIHDFVINERRKEIILKDGNRDMLVYYNFQGKKIKEVTFKFHFARFEVFNNGWYIFYLRYFGKNRYNIIITDSDFNIKQNLFPFSEEIQNGTQLYDPDQVFFKNGDTILVSYTYNEVISKINNDGVKGRISVKLPMINKLPPNLTTPEPKYSELQRFLSSKEGKNVIWNVSDFFKTDNGVYTMRLLSMDNAENILFYNPSTLNYHSSLYIGSDRTCCYLPFIGSRILGARKNSFFTVVPSKYILAQSAKVGSAFQNENCKIRNNLTGITSQSNPILVELTPKQF